MNCLACKYPFSYNVDMERISIITGHYGSGKTEFSLNYALKCSSEGKRTGFPIYFRFKTNKYKRCGREEEMAKITTLKIQEMKDRDGAS